MRILLVTPARPVNPANGAQQRTSLIYDALGSLGSVDVLGVHQRRSKREDHSTAGYTAVVTWKQYKAGLNKYLPDRSLTQRAEEALGISLSEYSIIVGRYLNPICKLSIPHHTPTLVDLDDFGYSYDSISSLLEPSTWVNITKKRYAQGLARRQLRRFDHYFFVSPADRKKHPDISAHILPNIPYHAPLKTSEPPLAGRNLLFVGALWYPPNRDGIDHFLRKIWPMVLEKEPNATLSLVGPAPKDHIRVWNENPCVSAKGFVDDLDSEYRDAAAVIAPIYFGGGTNIKILEASAYQRPCITTRFCFQGLQDCFDGINDLLIADSDYIFGQQTIRLLQDPKERRDRGKACAHIVRSCYSQERFKDTIQEGVMAALDVDK